MNQDKHQAYQEEERAAALRAVVDSDARLKLIVAGPGTGKSYTFRELFKGCGGQCLAMTFLVNLVRDLQLSVGDQADVYSFHGFAKKLLHLIPVDGLTRAVDYYPPIDQIYAQDISVVDCPIETAAVEEALVTLSDDGLVIPRVLRSGSYYNCVGHSDSVYRVFRKLESRPDQVPRYSQIVVDEYQDFNLLEVRLIELLSAVSPTLVVGDDDQALFGFKHASADFIRTLAADPSYAHFSLPYSSRCTSVLVASVHRVVSKAQGCGLLEGRISKPYVCFTPDKEEENILYPKITHARCTVENTKSPYIGRYIEQRIRQLPPPEVEESRANGYPTVLVVGPKEFIRPAHRYLSSALPNVQQRLTSPLVQRPLDGYLRLLRDRRSRLGWRILLELDKPSGWQEWIKSALIDDVELLDLVDNQYRDRHLRILDILDRLVAQEAIEPEDEELVTISTGLEATALAEALTPSDDRADPGTDDSRAEPEHETDQGEETGPTVLITSLRGAKGLEAGHVFVVGMNDQHFPRHNASPTNDEVCQLIVALTRARKSCTLISVRHFGRETLADSAFIGWLGPLVQPVQVNHAYLEDIR